MHVQSRRSLARDSRVLRQFEEIRSQSSYCAFSIQDFLPRLEDQHPIGFAGGVLAGGGEVTFALAVEWRAFDGLVLSARRIEPFGGDETAEAAQGHLNRPASR